MLEVFTIGGGEYVVNVLNAVSAWTGGGGFRALIRVVMVIGLAYSLLVVAFNLNWKAWLNWFLSATLMYSALIVPTTTVRVTDRINPSLAPAVVANVPVGLAAIASFSSQVGDWLTQQAETVFVMPDALAYKTNGMIYGARLYDKTRDFKFRDPRIRANLTEYFKQCLFYDFMLGQRNPAEVLNSTNILQDMGPGSPARAMKFWRADYSTEILTCQNAYNELRAPANIPAHTEDELTRAGVSFFPGLTQAAAKAKLDADLPEISASFHGTGQSSQQIFQQRALTDAFLEARANLSSDDGDTFAMMRAETQAKNTYTTIAQQAMTWVPLLNIVLTVVFYAMFPVLFPLFLMPQSGVTALKGYMTGFFYLAAWGPLYAVLHMFIMGRAGDAMAASAPSGFTMATMEPIDAVNADTSTIAGFLMMSIPFLAAGMARGAMAVSSQATSMLAPAQSAAEAAAVERTTGNYAYGNQSSQNLTSNVVQRDQWNTAPSFAGGFGRSTFMGENGSAYTVTADGSTVYDNRGAMSSLGFSANVSRSTQGDIATAASELETRRTALTEARSERIAALDRMGFSTSSGSRSSSGSESSNGSRRTASEGEAFSQTQGKSDNVGSSRDIAQSTEGSRTSDEAYSTGLNMNAGIGVNAGASAGGGRGGGQGPKAGGSISANTGVDARDSVNFSDGIRQARSDRSSNTSGEAYTTGENSSEDVRRATEGYSANGNFSRSEGFSENRSFRDKTWEEIRSIDRSLAEIDEAAASLGTTWTQRRGGGMQASQDMSQIIASRYQEYANNDEYRTLGAPSLQSTDLSPTQMRARDLIVENIMKDYIEDIMEPVRQQMVKPSELRGEVRGPSDFSEADLRPKMGGGRGAAGGNANEFADYDESINERIDAGRDGIAAGRAGAQAGRNSAVAGASDLGAEADEKMNRNWHDERKR